MVNGSDEQKYNWIFDLYDLNGDGFIMKDEMEDVVHSVIKADYHIFLLIISSYC